MRTWGVILVLFLGGTATAAPVVPSTSSQVRKDGLSLLIRVDKKVFAPGDAVTVRFRLRNETDHDLFVGDGFLGPAYQEVGPYRHFELHLTADRKAPLYFWSGQLTEGRTSGIRKVFKLQPGQSYEGSVCVRAAGKEDFAKQAPEERGGSLEDRTTRKKHVLGQDGRKYLVELLYQVNPEYRGAWEPPADFKEELLWKGAMWSGPIEFEVVGP
jgi:hypothetical protein